MKPLLLKIVPMLVLFFAVKSASTVGTLEDVVSAFNAKEYKKAYEGPR